jgi:hypothetical protein
LRLTCPAIAKMVESAAPLSASDLIAQCRRFGLRPEQQPEKAPDIADASLRTWHAIGEDRCSGSFGTRRLVLDDWRGLVSSAAAN